MPFIVSRADAKARVEVERGDSPCLMCALRDGLAGPKLLLDETDREIVLVSRYALRWGHALVIAKAHTVDITDLDEASWLSLSRAAQRTAKAIRAALSPLRCYVASLGTLRDDVAMTSPHVHFHVIPLYDRDDKPSQVLTWGNGVYDAEIEEWEALTAKLRRAMEET